ncbi:cyclase family protein [Lentzea sp. JNUCC 0626]|uniref:cyclase family protein n=1 Tax=Lentzea sp. JNUCC 0626 TaxID=3367513 RepID=UPI00374A5A0D
MTDAHDSSADPEGADPISNWGRWGADDERGCLNYITPDVRAAAVAEARTGRFVSLARPIDPLPLAGGPLATTTTKAPAPVTHAMTYTGFPPPALTDILTINTHHAELTHIDAFGHMPVDGKVYPGIPVGDVADSQGLHRSSTTAFASGILTRGVLADLAPGGALPPGHPVTGADLDRALARQNTRARPGDALVVRCGWDLPASSGRPTPGMTVDAVTWMHRNQVSVYLGDIGDAHPPVDPTLPFPLHRIGLARLGLPLVDAVAVDELAEACAELERYQFLLVIAPIPVPRATGVPVAPLAVF